MATSQEREHGTAADASDGAARPKVKQSTSRNVLLAFAFIVFAAIITAVAHSNAMPQNLAFEIDGVVDKLHSYYDSVHLNNSDNNSDNNHSSGDPPDSAAPNPRGSKPLNILLLYADDWSFTTLGALGNNYVATPRLDELAREGMLFTHNCVTTSICMVSRATLYTGQYASVHNTWQPYSDIGMYQGDNWEYSLFSMLRTSASNYVNALVGKWHHPSPPPYKAQPTFDFSRFYFGNHYPKRGDVVKHITQWNEEDAMEFLRKRPKRRPFLLTVSFFATHAEDGSKEQYRPMNSSMWMYVNEPVPRPKTMTQKHIDDLPPFFKKPNNFGRGRARKRYFPEEKFQHMMKNTYRMATEVDSACGRLIDELKAQGVYDDTLIIFTTDNGNFHGQHGLAEKWFAYEESIRVPLIIRDPRMPQKLRGTTNDEFTLNIDLAPTILGAANITVPERMQGRDIAQLYLNPHEAKATWRKEFWYEWVGPKIQLPSNTALVRKEAKYIFWPQYNYEQLFYLDNDPYEENDLLHTKNQTLLAEERERNHKNTLKEMKARMHELEQQVISGAKM